MPTLVERLKEPRAVAVLRADTLTQAKVAARSAIDAGFDMIEVSMAIPGASRLINRLSSERDLLLGAGAVDDLAIANEAIGQGAKFIALDYTDDALIKHVRNRNIVVVAGASTPTEALRAWKVGAALVRIFPVALLGGVDFMRILTMSLPNLLYMVHGGVELKDLIEYLNLGVRAVGLCSSIFPADLLESEDAEGLFKLAQQAVDQIKQFKKEV